jgi:hypothetical protein
MANRTTSGGKIPDHTFISSSPSLVSIPSGTLHVPLHVLISHEVRLLPTSEAHRIPRLPRSNPFCLAPAVMGTTNLGLGMGLAICRLVLNLQKANRNLGMELVGAELDSP